MTKVMCNIKPDSVYFDCLNHAEDHDVCTIISTLCNVAVAECIRNGIAPKVYEPGHVLIDAVFADRNATEVFESVMAVMTQVEDQNPKHVKVY